MSTLLEVLGIWCLVGFLAALLFGAAAKYGQDIPGRCEQFGCQQEAVTWCPLCRAYFCAEHDSLYPVRRHDCLRGKAEAA